MVSVILNGAIFAVTFVLVLRFFRQDGKWTAEKGKRIFRYFTCQSNILCATAALLTCVFSLNGIPPRWVWFLKYLGTAAVTVTMMTVFLYLAPALGGLGKLLAGSDLFFHLLTPVMALVSFCAFEKRGMDFATALAGMLPVVLYGILYLYKTVFAPEDKRWDDFYGFNKNGKWPVSMLAMAIATFLICMGLMVLQQ